MPDQLPFSYHGSFVVRNDGYLEYVYVVRVAVDDPAAIGWINVSPSGFVLAPGELRQVDFSIEVGEGQALPGPYKVVFMPTQLPLSVEPYLDTFANYVARLDRYRFTVDIPGNMGPMAEGRAAQGVPVVFGAAPERVNLVQFVSPGENDTILTQIDRAVRIDIPNGAPVGEPVPVSLSVYQSLSSRGIELMAVSPDGAFYPIAGGNFTFDRTGRWGVIALAGETVLLGKPLHVTPGGVRLVMPGIDSILAAVSLLLLLAIVPIWLAGRGAGRADPYDEIAYKVSVIEKYIDQFDSQRLRSAVGQLSEEYDRLVARHVRGRRREAASALRELETLADLEG